MLLLVFCNTNTPRTEYIFHFVLDVVCGFAYEVTSNETDYCAYEGPTLNYGFISLKQNDIEIRPNGLLALETITPCEAHFTKEGEHVNLYLKGSRLDETGFDLFAAAFYLLTRYEEYLPYVPDVYGRFEAGRSVMFKHRLLNRPLINEWAGTLRQTVLQKHPGTPFRQNRFQSKISIDVDQVFAFRHRGAVRGFLSLLKNILHRNRMFLHSQLKTVFSGDDPYNTFDYLKKAQLETALPFIYFINAGRYSKYDKNVPVGNGHFNKLLNNMKQYAEVGLHPSYFSNATPAKFKEEKDALESVIQQKITKSRQHYLKLRLPQTYRHLLAIGITEDYSMGYASHPGFRAGTCTPFCWFDLAKNSPAPLTVFPVVYMENAFAEDLQLDPVQTLTYMKELTDTVRTHQGCHISIWHNHTVNDALLWKGWKAVFEASLQHILKPSC